ncbi:hypothetical protein [uncultured Agrococcus sp.]|uniref:hypothetical protein n=1 Tax=uncultured Agrococcus sp. TaxID=382258 RepID=UPI0025D5B3D8|nr:hypothetical protein [uncultured Agrococcus sp.]
MQTGEHFPHDQAEVVFSDAAVEWLVAHEDEFDTDQLLDDVADLMRRPWGKKPLANRADTPGLAGYNTAEAEHRNLRIVFRSTVSDGVGQIQIITIGKRDNNRVYEIASDLVASGKLSAEEEWQIWELLRSISLQREILGLEEWEYQPPPAPEGMVKSVVAAGILDEVTASKLSIEELNAAMAAAWDDDGTVNVQRALEAAFSRVARSSSPDRILRTRAEQRCDAYMPRAKEHCIRREGHPGAHRSKP